MKTLLYVCVLAAAASAQTSPLWRDPSPHRVQFVTVDDGVRLEVLDWGGSGQAIVLLAGRGNTAHVFDEFAPKLTGFHVYGITRRGFGASSQPQQGYDDQRRADDIYQVLEFLHIAKPVLAGHSLAGDELTTLGRQHSDRLGGLIYLDALYDARDYPADDPAYMALYNRLPAPMRNRTPKATFPESELRSGSETNPDGTRGRYRTPRAIFDAIAAGQKRRDYSGIRVPVLVLRSVPPPYQPATAEERAAIQAFNGATDIYVSRWKRNLLSSVPEARIVDVPGSEHYLFLTNEADVLREMREFLQDLLTPYTIVGTWKSELHG
jgi:non-heme chloroperoxidase